MTTLRPSQVLRAGLVGLLLAAGLGCPPALQPDPLEPAPSITRFTASATQVESGGRVTLEWAVENATELRIEELALGLLSGVEGASGSVEVAVSKPALFVLTARNARGATDSAVVAVQLTGAPGALLFTAAPLAVEAGDAVTLAWSAPGAESLTITAAPGGPVDLGTQGSAGSLVLHPTVTTTYTLEAGGRAATATVTVRAAITAFTATPEAALPGATVTLAWTTVNAERVQLRAPGRATLFDSADGGMVASGTFTDTLPATVDPAMVFPYELTATAGGLTLTRAVQVTVAGSPAITSFTAPPAVRAVDGGVMTLAWTTSGADAVSLSANGTEFFRSRDRAEAVSGSVDLPAPTVDTTYELTATAERGGRATSTKVVESVGLPSVTVTASATTLTGGSPVTLSWSGQNLRNVAISRPGVGLVYRGSGMLDTGSTMVRLNQGATFTLTADNGLGQATTATYPAITVTSPITLTVAQTGSLRLGQDVTVSGPTAGANLIGLPHRDVTERLASTGFVDISSTGTRLTFPTTGNIVAPLDTDFRTVLFGRTVGEQIRVSRYGYLVFGDYLNGFNSVDEALPSAKLEPMAVAPYWESLTSTGVFWEVRSSGGASTLVVQWTSSTSSVQALISSSGQIDFEYGSLPSTVAGKAGIMGPTLESSLAAPGTLAVGRGLTFFGPKPSPVSVPAFFTGRVSAFVELAAGEAVRAEGTLTATLVRGDQLALTEALAQPTVGPAGQWLEFTSWAQGPIDLTGWALGLPDGGSAALSGTLPAGGTLVVGTNADPAFNDDAGVQLAVAGLALEADPWVSLTRAGLHQTFDLGFADGGRPGAGVALVGDLGPYAVASGSGFAAGARTCAATQGFGSQAPLQLGTPGRDTGCGFPYAKTTIAPGYFDISSTGTAVAFTSLRDANTEVSLAAAPVPYFGVAQTSMLVSTNGFISFASTASATDRFTYTSPSTTDTNALLAIFADDLELERAEFTDANVYVRRVGQGEDPFAAPPHWVVQWHHVTHFGGSDDLNFQVKLFDDGAIEYHFAELRSRSSLQYGSGGSSVTWLESPDGTQALTINANARVPGLMPHSAFRFVPR